MATQAHPGKEDGRCRHSDHKRILHKRQDLPHVLDKVRQHFHRRLCAPREGDQALLVLLERQRSCDRVWVQTFRGRGELRLFGGDRETEEFELEGERAGKVADRVPADRGEGELGCGVEGSTVG